MSPAEFAAGALRVPASDIVAVEPIKHGLTNESWLVRTPRDAVVVRISSAHDDVLRIDRGSEAAILHAVAAAGVGAPVVECDPFRRVLVTGYLGEPWSKDDADRDDNIRRLADLLRRLHALQTPAAVRSVDLLDTAEGYLATLREHGAGGELITASAVRHAREAALQLRSHGAARLCHNDVHHLNIVESGGLRLIDWEYAGMGEPLFDLASACVYHGYTIAQRELLLTTYVQRKQDFLPGRFDAALWLFAYIRDLWTACSEATAQRG